jgi:hypothetical protein
MLIISRTIINKESKIWITELAFSESVDKFYVIDKQ